MPLSSKRAAWRRWPLARAKCGYDAKLSVVGQDGILSYGWPDTCAVYPLNVEHLQLVCFCAMISGQIPRKGETK